MSYKKLIALKSGIPVSILLPLLTYFLLLHQFFAMCCAYLSPAHIINVKSKKACVDEDDDPNLDPAEQPELMFKLHRVTRDVGDNLPSCSSLEPQALASSLLILLIFFFRTAGGSGWAFEQNAPISAHCTNSQAIRCLYCSTNTIYAI